MSQCPLSPPPPPPSFLLAKSSPSDETEIVGPLRCRFAHVKEPTAVAKRPAAVEISPALGISWVRVCRCWVSSRKAIRIPLWNDSDSDFGQWRLNKIYRSKLQINGDVAGESVSEFKSRVKVEVAVLGFPS